MGSSFLTAVNGALALYCLVTFFKFILQFGLPNHPSRFTLYVATLATASYFGMKTLADLELISPFIFMRWRSLPLIVGSIALLLQAITTVGQFSVIQQKVISRIPIMSGLLFFFFFPQKADFFFVLILSVVVLFLTVSVGKARYQRRMLLKMSLFLILFILLASINYWTYILGTLFLFPALFYFFIFQQAYGVSALVDTHFDDSGVSS